MPTYDGARMAGVKGRSVEVEGKDREMGEEEEKGMMKQDGVVKRGLVRLLFM